MDRGHIMLSEVSQPKTSTVWYHLHVESKKPKSVKNQKTKTKKKESNIVVTREWGQGGGLRVMVFKVQICNK